MTLYKAATRRLWPALVLVGLMLAFGCSSGADPLTGVPQLPAVRDQAKYRLTAAPILAAATQSTHDSEFRVLASGSENARIVDQDREVVRSAPRGGTIFSFETSPNGKHVLIYFGSAKHSIASTDTFADLLTLPSMPPIQDDVTGFRWFFLDDNHLLGTSQLRSTDTAGRMASEIDALLPRATLLYIYTLETKTLTPVEIDDTLPPIFFMHNVSGWNVTLLTYDDDLMGARIIRSAAVGDTNPP